jgi:predicted MFS family arabinose efflux permease
VLGGGVRDRVRDSRPDGSSNAASQPPDAAGSGFRHQRGARWSNSDGNLGGRVHDEPCDYLRLGMLGVLLSFGGHFAFFTYLRPFLEVVTHVGVRELSGILLGSGIATVVGTSLAGAVVARNLRLTLVLMPLLMSVLAAALVVFGSIPLVTAVLVALWGLAFSIIPVGWSTWLTRTVPDEAESGGGLFVATTQLAITLGAAAGGIIIDYNGAVGVVVVSGIALLLASVVTALGLRARAASPDHQAASGRSA